MLGEFRERKLTIIEDLIFEEYRISSEANDNIWLEVSSDPFYRAVRSCRGSTEAVCRLKKKDGCPMLTFEIVSQVWGGLEPGRGPAHASVLLTHCSHLRGFPEVRCIWCRTSL